MEIIKPNKKALNKAVKVIKKGGVVISPTDTVYGILADATNKKAVEKIFKIKKRSRQKTLPVFVKDIKMAKQIAEIDKKQEKILKKYWPGKYTFILNSKLKTQNSKLLTKNGTIALRVPKYKFLNDLLKKINRPLAQTSVNISGEPPMTKISDIKEFIRRTGFRMLIVDGGDSRNSKPSKIIDLTSKRLTRLR